MLRAFARTAPHPSIRRDEMSLRRLGGPSKFLIIYRGVKIALSRARGGRQGIQMA
jgi:hypothetical protein